MYRILNAETKCRFPAIPADPQVEAVRLPGHDVLYDANSMAAAEVDAGLADAVAEGKAPPDLPPPMNWPFKPQFPFRGATECRALVLEATHACNLACAYCFVRNYGEDQSGAMDMETAVRAVGMIPPGRPVSVGFFGGEPLLNWNLVKGVAEHVGDLARKRGVSKSLHVTTNAILLDEERIRFLDGHGFSMIVSLDGPAEIHNRLRPAKGGKADSHGATLANLRKLKGTRQLRLRTTLRSTYTGLGADLAARLEYLNALADEGCASHVSVEPCSLNETACLQLPDGHPLAITPAHFGGLEREYREAAEWYAARIRAGKQPRFHHFMKPLERLLYTLHAPSECGAGCGYLAVDPAGNVYGCHRESKSLVGSLEGGLDEELRAQWKDNRIYARQGCGACAAKHVCGGGCRLDSLERHGDIRKPDATGCFFKRRMFEEALWLLCELGPERLQAVVRNPRARHRRPAAGRPRLRADQRTERTGTR